MLNVSNFHRPSLSIFAVSLIASACLLGCGGGGTANKNEAPLNAAADVATVGVADVTLTSALSAMPEATGAQTSGATDSTEMSTSNPAAATCVAATWASFDRPFAATSPWNRRPVGATLGTAVVPTSLYYPSVAAGAYSSAAFKATAANTAVIVAGNSAKGIWDPDSETYKANITIPHWPAGVIPATGADGHAEIVDTSTGIVHSFWQLKQVNGTWQAAQYAWTPLAGRGMGDPSHYFQGARAAGVSTLGGLMRKSEVNNGGPMYRHALAMSLAANGLAANPSYKYPATSADRDASTVNTGNIPMGARLMLPKTFNAQALATPELRKVAETLKTYGAIVVDRNYGTPFAIYVEIGANFKLHKTGWSNATAADLDKIRAALRPLESASSWLDGNSQAYSVDDTNLNLLSMRGYWYRTKGTQSGVFDTWLQAVVFPATTTPIEQINSGGRAYAGVTWATPVAGVAYRLTTTATDGARFRMTITDKTTNVVVYDSGDMSNAQVVDFVWPATNFNIVTYAKSGVGVTPSTVKAELLKIDDNNPQPSTFTCAT